MSNTATTPRFPPYERHVFICMNERPPGNPRGDCKSKGAEAVLNRFKELVDGLKLKPRIRAQKSGCLDTCEAGISVVVYPEAVWYKRVTLADVDEIVQSHLVSGVPVERLRMHPRPTSVSGPVKPIGNA
ncbi:MAG: (2Fe-2S) ferredoxin domain-containing protein [Planctomycetes bacterium]|nr:(2Fe-2S) ferredoxin domain-containing protein [Planctomycetota bacterium]